MTVLSTLFKATVISFLSIAGLQSCERTYLPTRVFDVHLHGSPEQADQLARLRHHGVTKIALSSSWTLQQSYEKSADLDVLQGLMLPCPNGKVPYSGQSCFENGEEWPSLEWVEALMKERKIQFLGEVLTQYHGISMSDPAIFPYYSLAEKYEIPVGIHTGSAGPDHGCPNFKEELGTPALLEDALKTFPAMKVWIMHAGAPYHDEAIRMLKTYPQLYADISVINNPDITSQPEFENLMRKMIDAGLEDRMMFGSDNADMEKVLNSILNLRMLSANQKDKILFVNAERFFAKTEKSTER